MLINKLHVNDHYNKILKKLSDITNVLLDNKAINNGLLNGSWGQAMFLFQYSHFTDQESIADEAVKLIENSIETLYNVDSDYSFSHGITGLANTLTFLNENRFIDSKPNEIIEDLDRHLFEASSIMIANNNYEYLFGSMGPGLYFINNIENDFSVKGLESIILGLQKTLSQKSSNKGSWINMNRFKKNPEPIDMNLAHGMAGALLFLVQVHSKNILRPICEYLINSYVDFFMSLKLDIDVYKNYFPYRSDKKSISDLSTRLAWCAGDLGIGYALLKSAEVLKSDELKKISHIVLSNSSEKRLLEENGIYDATICHGAAGVAQLFTRLYEDYPFPNYLEARDFWLNKTLHMDIFKNGLAGYKTHYFDGKDHHWNNETGLLEGICGTALVLLNSLDQNDSNWDFILLLKSLN